MKKCQLVVSRKENIVASGTIVRECRPNYLVVVDASYKPNTLLPIPIPMTLLLLEKLSGMKFYGPLI